MADTNESVELGAPQADDELDIDVESLSSVALARLAEEVRNDVDHEFTTTTAYNRTYHRHNR